MEYTKLIETIESKPSLDFGSIFSRSFELFKKVWVQGLITVLITVGLMIPFMLVFYMPLIAMGIADPDSLDSGDLEPLMIVVMIICYLLLIVAAMIIGTALNAAFLRICKQKDLGEEGKDDYFYYLKKQYYGKLITLGLIAFGISLLGTLALFIGAIYVAVPISLIPVFFAFHSEKTPMEIIRASFSLGNKNWFVIFGLLIVMGIISSLGVILCYVGVFATAMLAKIPIYYIYKDGVGFEEEAKKIEE